MAQPTELFSAEFLDLLRCPIEGVSLQIAGPDTIQQINDSIQRGSLKNRLGDPLTEPFEAGLVNANRTWLYRVTNQIPSLLADEAVSLAGWGQAETPTADAAENEADLLPDPDQELNDG